MNTAFSNNDTSSYGFTGYSSTSCPSPNNRYHYHYHYPMENPMNIPNNLYEEYDMGNGWMKIVCLDPPCTIQNPTGQWRLRDYDYHKDWLNTEETTVKPEQPGSNEPELVEIKIEKPPPTVFDVEAQTYSMPSKSEPKETPTRLLSEEYYNEEKEDDYVEVSSPLLDKGHMYQVGDKVDYFKDGYWYYAEIVDIGEDNTYSIRYVNEKGQYTTLYEVTDWTIRECVAYTKGMEVEVVWQGKWYLAKVLEVHNNNIDSPTVEYIDKTYTGKEYAVISDRIRMMD